MNSPKRPRHIAPFPVHKMDLQMRLATSEHGRRRWQTDVSRYRGLKSDVTPGSPYFAVLEGAANKLMDLEQRASEVFDA